MHLFCLNFSLQKTLKKLHIFEIEDKLFEKAFIDTISKANIDIEIHKTPMFIFDRDKFKTMAKGKKGI